MVVGRFYEMYSLDDKHYSDFDEIGMLLNLCIGKRKYKDSQYFVLGFPILCSNQYYKTLIDDGKYVVVTIEQDQSINVCGISNYNGDTENNDNCYKEQEEIGTITI